MKIPRPLALVMIFALIATSAVIVACSNNDNNGGVLNPPAKELDSADILHLGTYSHTFKNVGTFAYHCKHHSMTSTVIVVVGAPATASVSITDNMFSGSVSVDTSGTVTWTNNGNNAHTVTSN
jgi:plastocyanin